MAFLDELTNLKSKLAEEQEQKLALERRVDELGSELRIAKDRAGKAETRAEQAETERDEASRRATDALKRADEFTVTVIQRDQAVSDLNTTGKKLIDTQERLTSERARRKLVEKDLVDTKQILSDRQKEFVESQELLSAFRQGAEALGLIQAA